MSIVLGSKIPEGTTTSRKIFVEVTKRWVCEVDATTHTSNRITTVDWPETDQVFQQIEDNDGYVLTITTLKEPLTYDQSHTLKLTHHYRKDVA